MRFFSIRNRPPSISARSRLYTCGGERYMDAVSAAASRHWPEAALAREFFTIPEPPDWVNHLFTLELARSGHSIAVTADLSAAEALGEAGVVVTTKSSDGIRGVFATPHFGSVIEHRDYALFRAERVRKVILCCSRAAEREASSASTSDPRPRSDRQSVAMKSKTTPTGRNSLLRGADRS